MGWGWFFLSIEMRFNGEMMETSWDNMEVQPTTTTF
jgi:hypothetical protein